MCMGPTVATQRNKNKTTRWFNTESSCKAWRLEYSWSTAAFVWAYASYVARRTAYHRLPYKPTETYRMHSCHIHTCRLMCFSLITRIITHHVSATLLHLTFDLFAFAFVLVRSVVVRSLSVRYDTAFCVFRYGNLCSALLCLFVLALLCFVCHCVMCAIFNAGAQSMLQSATATRAIYP
jgi:hypothetical protein